MEKADDWDLVINSRSSLFDLRLKKVWDYRDLLFLFVKRDFIATYKQTILGPIWFFIQPISTMIVYIFIFSNLAGLSTDGIPPPLFYLVGITCWSFFSESLLKTSVLFKDNAAIFGKVYFPRLISPLSIIFSSLIKFGVQITLLVAVMIYYAVTGTTLSPSLYLLLTPVLIILLALMALGFGMIVSSLTNKYRDLGLLLSLGIQLFMYATTVVYPLSSLAGKWRMVAALNPASLVIEGMRLGLLGKGTFELSNLLYLVPLTCVVLFSGVIIFNKAEKNFIDIV